MQFQRVPNRQFYLQICGSLCERLPASRSLVMVRDDEDELKLAPEAERDRSYQEQE